MSNEQKEFIGSAKVEIKFTRQFINDVMDTAGYAVAYWAAASKRLEVTNDGPDFCIEEQDASAVEGVKAFVVSEESVMIGCRRLLDPAFNIRSDIRETLFGAMIEDDASNVDSEVADAIVQAAMFNEIVYG